MTSKIKALVAIITFCFFTNSYSQEVIDLFIWAGQSNAQGWAGDAASYPADPNNLDSQTRLHYTFHGTSASNAWIPMGAQTGRYTAGHFGPEVSFARKLKEAGYNPAIFKYCQGGTSLNGNWKAPGAGGIYDSMVNKYNAAIADLVNQGHTVNVRGFIWIQGESDAIVAADASAYHTNLTNLINDLRNNVVNNASLPIILGVDEQFQFQSLVTDPKVLNAHLDIAQNDANIKFSSMHGFQKIDYTHLTPAALVPHGEHVFDVFKSIVDNTTPDDSCATSSEGTVVSTVNRSSWGQSFKPNCSGKLSEITFNAATNLSSSLTLSILTGVSCDAVSLHSQTINSIVDGDNTITIPGNIILDKNQTYYMNISSDTNTNWHIRFSTTNKVIGNLKTYLDTETSTECGWDFPNYDLDFSVIVGDKNLIEEEEEPTTTEQSVPLSNGQSETIADADQGGKMTDSHYGWFLPGLYRNKFEFLYNDEFIYNADNPTSTGPDASVSNTENYLLTHNEAIANWFSLDMSIPNGRSLKSLDLWDRAGTGGENRARDLKITLSYGSTSETYNWTGPAAGADHGRLDLTTDFSSDLLNNATTIRIDFANDAYIEHLEIMEVRVTSVNSSLSIATVENEKLIIAPNPIEEGETLHLKNTGDNTIQIYSILGTLIYETTSESIDYNVFPSSGIYIIKIGSTSSKLIVK